MKEKSAYAAAGVDIDTKYDAVRRMTAAVRSTYGPEVLWGMGAFGGLFDASRLKAMRAPVLVGSTDGVGTKIMVAMALGSYATLGQDIVNHCVNDILVQGAEPLFFLDYVAAPRIEPEAIAAIVGGMAEACLAAGCAILGGETAEMPGVYQPGEIDIVGTIVGVVERDEIIDGSTITPGDVLIGLPSSGLHTNGYTLARRVFPPESFGRYAESLGCAVGEALVTPHRSYLPHVRALRQAATIKGLAHITGGGYPDNLPRILPQGCLAVVERSAWSPPPLFQLIQELGGVERDEMYRVFNMGMGMVVIVAPQEAERALAAAGVGAVVIGHIAPQTGVERVALR
ncbi:MAG: phosphoribosylformylglycinamidine cyclo-ligase [Chloroflexota bacterium]